MTPRNKSFVFGTAAGAIALVAVFFLKNRTPDLASIQSAGSASTPATAQSTTPSENALRSAATGATSQPVTLTQLDAASQAQVKILDEVLTSRNDNDPRLDRELKTLNPSARSAFRTRYQTLPKEDRNGRGTVVFLLGRNLETLEDLGFLEDVLNEAPCFSLDDCVRDTKAAVGDDAHHDSTIEITLAYPQLAALSALEIFLKSESAGQKKSPERDKAIQDLETASRSPIPRIANKAAEILHSIRNSGTA